MWSSPKPQLFLFHFVLNKISLSLSAAEWTFCIGAEMEPSPPCRCFLLPAFTCPQLAKRQSPFSLPLLCRRVPPSQIGNCPHLWFPVSSTEGSILFLTGGAVDWCFPVIMASLPWLHHNHTLGPLKAVSLTVVAASASASASASRGPRGSELAGWLTGWARALQGGGPGPGQEDKEFSCPWP